MIQFRYTALTDAGAKVSGTLEAETQGAVLRVLEERNLFPLSIVGTGDLNKEQKARRRVRTRDVGVMYGQLADLIGSGVPLLRALDSLVRSTVNAKLVEVLKDVRASVADGKSLTEALREFPEVFPPLHRAMVQAGERAAFLEE